MVHSYFVLYVEVKALRVFILWLYGLKQSDIFFFKVSTSVYVSGIEYTRRLSLCVVHVGLSHLVTLWQSSFTGTIWDDSEAGERKRRGRRTGWGGGTRRRRQTRRKKAKVKDGRRFLHLVTSDGFGLEDKERRRRSTGGSGGGEKVSSRAVSVWGGGAEGRNFGTVSTRRRRRGEEVGWDWRQVCDRVLAERWWGWHEEEGEEQEALSHFH